jgi:hypothetical protein
VDPCLDPIWIVFANLWREIWRRPHGWVGLEHWGQSGDRLSLSRSSLLSVSTPNDFHYGISSKVM